MANDNQNIDTTLTQGSAINAATPSSELPLIAPSTKLKVMTVVGTRPEIIRLSRVMAALYRAEAIEHTTIHTGQNYDYELN